MCFSIDSLYAWFRRSPYLVFWISVFCATALMALFVQLVMLPHLFPELHAGSGLLIGGDWVGFHMIAVELAEKVHAQGWSAWELRPHNHPPAGIAAAIYTLTVPEPYVLIPLNATLHATTGVVLMRIFRYLTNSDFIALCAALPFVAYPSTMAWYAQIHKDGFYFAGTFLCLYGWILLARVPTWQLGWRPVLAGLAWLGAGVALMGLVRPHSFQVMQGMGFILAMGLTMLFIVRGVKKKLPWKSCAAAIVILFLVPLLLRLAPIDPKLSSEVPATTFINESAENLYPPNRQTLSLAEASVKDCWRPSNWLPNLVENNFLWLAIQRDKYILREPGLDKNQKAGSMIDINVHLSSAQDFITYLPRAVQIGLFAPFPIHWIAQGASPGGSMMRRLAGAEMIGVYCALLFLPYALWRWRNRVEMWLPVAFGTILILVYTFATPNLGSLYRQRYGFLMLLVGIGVAGCFNLLKQRASRQTNKR